MDPTLIIQTVIGVLVILFVACGLTAVLTWRITEDRAKRREDTLQAEIDILWGALREQRDGLDHLRDVVNENIDRDESVEALVVELSTLLPAKPRERYAAPLERPALELPPAPRVVDLNPPQWNGATRTFDRIAARHPNIHTTELWAPDRPITAFTRAEAEQVRAMDDAAKAVAA